MRRASRRDSDRPAVISSETCLAAVGLFDRAEGGVTVQSLNEAAEGGNMWGVFGRLRLWEPVDQGLGLAVGGRYLTSPTFAGPGFGRGASMRRAGWAFPTSVSATRTRVGMASALNLSLYGVATAYLRGYDGGFLPENDMTFSLGYGGGMFAGRQEARVSMRRAPAADGLRGPRCTSPLGERSQVTVMAEHNGFDVNLGAQVDWDGVRLGVQGLALNHDWPQDGQFSEYQKPKVGFTLSARDLPARAGIPLPPPHDAPDRA